MKNNKRKSKATKDWIWLSKIVLAASNKALGRL
jgi:hypothetical protein